MNTLLSSFFHGAPLLMGAPDQAGGAGGTTASLISTFIPFGLVILIFYFLIIRPQNKKQKETQKMLSALKKGDRVVTVGGVHGTIQSVKENTVILKVDESTKMEFSRSAISSVLEVAKAEPSKVEAQKADPKEEKAISETEETKK
jgi:preprotein translocase subunit YajC